MRCASSSRCCRRAVGHVCSLLWPLFFDRFVSFFPPLFFSLFSFLLFSLFLFLFSHLVAQSSLITLLFFPFRVFVPSCACSRPLCAIVSPCPTLNPPSSPLLPCFLSAALLFFLAADRSLPWPRPPSSRPLTRPPPIAALTVPETTGGPNSKRKKMRWKTPARASRAPMTRRSAPLLPELPELPELSRRPLLCPRSTTR